MTKTSLLWLFLTRRSCHLFRLLVVYTSMTWAGTLHDAKPLHLSTLSRITWICLLLGRSSKRKRPELFTTCLVGPLQPHFGTWLHITWSEIVLLMFLMLIAHLVFLDQTLEVWRVKLCATPLLLLLSYHHWQSQKLCLSIISILFSQQIYFIWTTSYFSSPSPGIYNSRQLNILPTKHMI